MEEEEEKEERKKGFPISSFNVEFNTERIRHSLPSEQSSHYGTHQLQVRYPQAGIMYHFVQPCPG
eukprot:m.194526 g.194526  ORF g.194526 m.194526 type:complete len:65 (+) comp16792_c0_seq2:2021-2215(+)